jgi:very-short-patch-repair endonuclease
MKRLTQQEVIQRFTEIHKGKYDYSKVVYKNNSTKVEILCKKHGPFFQQPNAHKDSKQGCPGCKESKGETRIRVFLEINSIEFIPQHSYEDCKYKNKLLFDFYLPKYGLIVEFDGKQHYEPIEGLHGRPDYDFDYQQLKDKIKNEYCSKNNIPLLRIPYTSINNIEKIIENYLGI